MILTTNNPEKPLMECAVGMTVNIVFRKETTPNYSVCIQRFHQKLKGSWYMSGYGQNLKSGFQAVDLHVPLMYWYIYT